jgi:transcriptional regulator with XRE-family HTH domain
MKQQKTKQKTQAEKEFNTRISKRMKVIRETLNLTLEDLGKILNVSFQQAQKYENQDSDISFYKLHLFLDYCREHKGRSFTLDEFVSSKELELTIKI